MEKHQEVSDIVREAVRLGLKYSDKGFFYYPGGPIVGSLGASKRGLPFIREAREGYEVVKKGFYGSLAVFTESPRLAVFSMIHLWAREKRKEAGRFISTLLRTARSIARKTKLGETEICNNIYRGMGCTGKAKLLAAAISLYSIARYESFREPLEPSLHYLVENGDLRRAGITGEPYLSPSITILLKLASGLARSEREARKKAANMASRVIKSARREYFHARAGWLLARMLVPGIDPEKILPLVMVLALSGYIKGPFLIRLKGFNPLQSLLSEASLLMDTDLLIEVKSPVETASTSLSLDSSNKKVHVGYRLGGHVAERAEELVETQTCSKLSRGKIALVRGSSESVECVKEIIARGYGALVVSGGASVLVKLLDREIKAVVYSVGNEGLKSFIEALKRLGNPCVLDPVTIYRSIYRGKTDNLNTILRCKNQE
ncbi:MAG: hypothetical protein F7C07_01110 [Desulfurococcales archaeon]|nr:hypothetical protein [Desulfurococcales archaeon]